MKYLVTLFFEALHEFFHCAIASWNPNLIDLYLFLESFVNFTTTTHSTQSLLLGNNFTTPMLIAVRCIFCLYAAHSPLGIIVFRGLMFV